MKYTADYLKIKELIKEADAVLIGLGSGISAAGGLDYFSEDVFKKLYPKYYEKGYKYIFHAISEHWVCNITEENCYDYWNFWTRHIYNVRYNVDTLLPYKLLKEIVLNKNYFAITTNGDGQTQRVFENVYAPQGDYSLFQCRVNCNDKLYDNKEFVLENLDNVKTIPRCSNCGDFLIPNLRVDNYFCETFGQTNYEKYYNFLMENKNKKLVILELGVGFNTPSIIRFPFDKLSTLQNATLVRVNSSDPDVIHGFGISEDITKVLLNLKE